MKKRGMLFIITLFAACQVVARQPVASVSAPQTTATGEKKFNQSTPIRPAESGNSLEPVKGIDVRAWTTTVGWHPGVSAFPNAATYSCRLHLLCFGHKPW